ncbi:lon protease homolog 2, peroxisomal [Monosporozyma servazzii]
MFFQKKKQERLTERICPCLTLSNVPSLVVLPGVRYDITFDKQMSGKIIEYFKQHRHLNFDTIKKIELEMHLNEGVATSKLIPNNNNNNNNNNTSHDIKTQGNATVVTYPNFLLLNKYVCLIPGKSVDYATGCISKIVNVTRNGPDSYKISFKAIRRGGIVTPLYNSDGQIWGSDIIMFDEWNKLNDMHSEKIKQGTLKLIECVDKVQNHISEFNSRYRNALKSNSKEHMLLLTPLSNTLYFQLNKTQFKSSWSMIFNQFQNLKNGYLIKKESNEISYKFLKLIDFIVSVLPTSSLQKLEFLSTLELDARVETFIKIMNDFNQIFEQLFFSLEYINRYYEGASTLEKANLIANQLRSLKVFIEDIKVANKQKLLMPTSSSENPSIIKRSLPKPDMKHGGDYQKGNNTNTFEMEDESDEDDSNDDMSQIKKFIHSMKHLKIHEDGAKLLKKDFKRLNGMNRTSAEYQLIKNYFDIILDLPFNKYTHQKEEINILQCKRQLDKDHFGLYSVKKRLLEYLCVLKLNDQLNGAKSHPPILLLVGPPGVGKTSIAKSISTVLDRNYQRISLGGVHDESDLRGHRRTYVGSMCGMVINSLRRSGTMNPLILLDEIDKVASGGGGGTRRGGSGGGGDAAAALLEILDPEQNCSFTDHFVGFPVDLSQVLFICTANDTSLISRPLLDRMEVINIPGYTMEDKIRIGSEFLLPKQINLNGLNKCENGNFTLRSDTWEILVNEYTREFGVRSLQREISKIVRGKISEYIENGNKLSDNNREIKPNQLIKYLGFPLHGMMKELFYNIPHSPNFGIVNGLSYNSNGTGSVLIFEIIEIGGEEKQGTIGDGPYVKSTGNLGTILQESIDIGISVVKSILQRDIILNNNGNGDDGKKQLYRNFTRKQLHLHVPMGSISKDGPSAGMAITLALMSIALQRSIDPLLCMTGEITLRGKILPIGGLKEKLLGAKMYGMKRVLIPAGNRNDTIEAMIEMNELQAHNDIDELSLVYDKMGLQATYVNDIYDVLPLVWPDIKLRPVALPTLGGFTVPSPSSSPNPSNRAGFRQPLASSSTSSRSSNCPAPRQPPRPSPSPMPSSNPSKL